MYFPKPPPCARLSYVGHGAAVIYWTIFLGTPVTFLVLGEPLVPNLSVIVMLGLAAVMMTCAANHAWRVSRRETLVRTIQEGLRTHPGGEP